MKLHEFVEQTGIPLTKMALRCNLSFHQRYHITRGGVPTLRTALSIAQYTKGKVQARDMLSEQMIEEIYGENKKEKEPAA